MIKYEGNFDVNSLHTFFVEVFSKINKEDVEVEIECDYGVSMVFYEVGVESIVNISVIEDEMVLYHNEYSTTKKDFWKLAEDSSNFLTGITK